MSVMVNGLKLAQNIEVKSLGDCFFDLVIDGERFPYHLSLDDGIQIDEPEYDENGLLMQLGVVHVGIVFDPTFALDHGIS